MNLKTLWDSTYHLVPDYFKISKYLLQQLLTLITEICMSILDLPLTKHHDLSDVKQKLILSWFRKLEV